MGNFRGGRDNRSGGFGRDRRFGGGGGRGFGNRDERRPVQMHEAVCDECGKNCEVPFKPSGDRPVLCSSCFEMAGGGNRRNSRDRGDRDSFRSEPREKRMFDAVCDECGQNCEVPFRPSGEKPVLCSSCFNNQADSKKVKADDSKVQFDLINEKLDRIINALSPILTVKVDKKGEKPDKKTSKVEKKEKTGKKGVKKAKVEKK